MIPALLIGREGSSGFPGKNIYIVVGRHMMEYPLLAAKHSKYVDEIYISTDSKKIKEIGSKYGTKIIERPPELCTNQALGEDVFAHGYRYIRDTSGKPIELVVLLFCNAPTVLAKTIDEAIELLRKNPEADSAVSVSIYNMWSPLRARKLGKDGFLYPFVPFEVFGDVSKLSCDRDSQGDVYFADMGVSVVRPHCLENLKEGLLPQRWMGKKILPVLQWGGLDVDFKWQIPLVEYWLKEHGFTETRTPYE
ncbi:MAG: cytidylyltransferase [Candidatus Omnitrophica bacterium]|jgi:hypothetical protein|nr:cytidylyltransferase [Candidatus Omnitrophota bacterium]